VRLHNLSSAATAIPVPRLLVRPPLKWAGGKRQLLPAIGRLYPEHFSRYTEAFFGSGAVFFDLFGTGRLGSRAARLCDVNPDLIGCYRTLRDRPDDVIAALEVLAEEYRQDGERCYYDVRDRRFNPSRAALASGCGADLQCSADAYTPQLAAMLIFLNRTGFNGLFRLNRSGGFNVPAGRYADPRICDESHLRAVADTFASHDISLELASFDDTLASVGDGDFVYCDPPYAPLSRTSSFASYTAAGFGPADQVRLQRAVVAACQRGATVIVSNSSAAEILDLYTAPEAQAAGLVVHRVAARRSINSRAMARGPVDEFLISNVAGPLRMVQPAMLRAQLDETRRRA
jgi:DNA adenine methylase